VGALERQEGSVLLAPPRVGDEGVAYTLVDAASGSNPSRGWAETRRPMDARAHSPGAAWRWHCHSIDTVRARDRDGNCGCWPRTPHAGSHRLPYAARALQASGQRDSVASHRVGGQSLVPRNGQLSRAGLRRLSRTPEQEPAWRSPCAQMGERKRTQSCAPDQDGADGPVPDADSTPIG
jgi:hypothetical protein